MIFVIEVFQGFQSTGIIHKTGPDHTKTNPWLQAGMFENKQTFRGLASNDLLNAPPNLKFSLSFFQVKMLSGDQGLWNPNTVERKTNRLPRSGPVWCDLETFCFPFQDPLHVSLGYRLKSGIPTEFISIENLLCSRHRTRWFYIYSLIWILQRHHLIIPREVMAEKTGWWESSEI